MFEVNQLSWSVTKNSISTEMSIEMDTEQPHNHQHREKNVRKQPSNLVLEQHWPAQFGLGFIFCFIFLFLL